jgi:hypothetical protein
MAQIFLGLSPFAPRKGALHKSRTVVTSVGSATNASNAAIMRSAANYIDASRNSKPNAKAQLSGGLGGRLLAKIIWPPTSGTARCSARLCSAFLLPLSSCILPVKLEPGKTYVFWLNPPKFQGFKDTEGNAAIFYPLVFETKP